MKMSISPSYGLAIHTTSPELGLAIGNFADDYRCQTWELGRDLSTHLHQILVEFMPPQSWQDVAFIAVAQGPGSFTGTRIGVVTARTLAQQLKIPLFAISSLQAMAFNYFTKQNHSRAKIAVEMLAQRGEIFTAIYQFQVTELGCQIITLLPDGVMKPLVWKETLEELELSDNLIKIEGNLGESVSGLLKIAAQDWQQGKRPNWSDALPYYGQHPVVLSTG